MGVKDDAHKLISLLKKIAVQHGRTPTVFEFLEEAPITKHRLYTALGGYAALVQAAGLDPPKKNKIDNSIFEASIENALKDPNRPKAIIDPLGAKLGDARILIAGDHHQPFIRNDCFDAFYKFAKEVNPTHIIQIGDLYDMYAYSKFAKSLNIYTPKEELSLGRKGSEEFWSKCQKAAPNAKCYQILGNHDWRPYKRVLDAIPEAEDSFREMFLNWFRFPGVELIPDPRQELFINGVAIFHGYRSNIGDHMDHLLMCVAVGHGHRGGVVYRNIFDAESGINKIIWELNVGHMADPESKVLSYTPQKITKSTNGWGYIDRWGPRFIPYAKPKNK